MNSNKPYMQIAFEILVQEKIILHGIMAACDLSRRLNAYIKKPKVQKDGYQIKC